MHIPDGFLSPPVWATLDVVSAGTVVASAKHVEKRLDERRVPALAVLAAFIFAAQMINFPVAGGTSGHFVGATLAAILLGPRAALLVMFTVLGAQCLLHQDGGLLALGANVLNMGIIGVFAGYALFRVVERLGGKRRRSLAAFAAAWVSVVLSALAVGLELAASGTVAAGIVLQAMLGWHAVIGIGEGLITAAALSALQRTRPDLLEMERV